MKTLRVTWLLATACLALSISPTAQAKIVPEAFNGKTCTVFGTSSADNLTGTSKSDVICGLGGNDTIAGLGGNDTIDGGSGDDEIQSGDGDDAVFGGSGDDEILSGKGEDEVVGQAGEDRIELGSGDDEALGGSGSDKLFGGIGVDILKGEGGDDSLLGGRGNDSLFGGSGVDYCDGVGNDSAISCFFDNEGPRLRAIAFEDSKIDTNSSAVVAVLRARIEDLGTGLSQSYLSFKGITDNGPLHLNVTFQNVECQNPAVSNEDFINDAVNEPFNSSQGCRISGDEFSGVYEARILIPRFSPKTKFTLEHFDATDEVNNNLTWHQSSLKAKKLRALLIQQGKGDNRRPNLLSAKIINKEINVGDGGTVLTLRARATDGLSGIRKINLSFRTGKDKWNPKDEIDFLATVDSCTTDEAPTPQPINKAFTGCLIYGTSKDGVYEMKVYISSQIREGKYKLFSWSVEDYVGNGRGFSPDITAKSPVTINSFVVKNSSPGDQSSPVVDAVDVITSSLDTSQRSEVAVIRVSARDSGLGISGLSLNFRNSSAAMGSSSEVKFVYSEDNSTCTSRNKAQTPTVKFPRTACLISGSKRNGIYEMRALVKAHSMSGQFKLTWGSVSDFAGNDSGISADKFNVEFSNQ